MTANASGAPNVVCAQLRDALLTVDLPRRQAIHMDAAVERLVHAYAGTSETVSVEMTVTAAVFSLTFA